MTAAIIFAVGIFAIFIAVIAWALCRMAAIADSEEER